MTNSQLQSEFGAWVWKVRRELLIAILKGNDRRRNELTSLLMGMGLVGTVREIEYDARRLAVLQSLEAA